MAAIEPWVRMRVVPQVRPILRGEAHCHARYFSSNTMCWRGGQRPRGGHRARVWAAFLGAVQRNAQLRPEGRGRGDARDRCGGLQSWTLCAGTRRCATPRPKGPLQWEGRPMWSNGVGNRGRWSGWFERSARSRLRRRRVSATSLLPVFRRWSAAATVPSSGPLRRRGSRHGLRGRWTRSTRTSKRSARRKE